MIFFRRRKRSDPLIEEFTRVMEPLLEQALYDAGLRDVKTKAKPEEGRVEALGSRGEGYSKSLLLEKVADAVEAALSRLGWKPLRPVREAFFSLPTLKPSTLTRKLEAVSGGLAGRLGEQLDRLTPDAAFASVEAEAPDGSRVTVSVEVVEVLGKAGATVVARRGG